MSTPRSLCVILLLEHVFMLYPASFATIDTSNGIVRQIVWPMCQGYLPRNVGLI